MTVKNYNAAIQAVPMPDRIKALPVSPTGYPVPWFVAYIDGVPDFRVVRPRGIEQSHTRKTCWVCGQPMGRFVAMTIGPMCSITRTISEPPAHRECAIYSVLACPFLSNPRMRRREVGMPENAHPAPGLAILRNPGAMAVWVTRGYRAFKADDGILFTFDDPVEVLWFAEGRPALRSEVARSIASGLPLLEAEAQRQGAAALAELPRAIERANTYLPA